MYADHFFLSFNIVIKRLPGRWLCLVCRRLFNIFIAFVVVFFFFFFSFDSSAPCRSFSFLSYCATAASQLLMLYSPVQQRGIYSNPFVILPVTWKNTTSSFLFICDVIAGHSFIIYVHQFAWMPSTSFLVPRENDFIIAQLNSSKWTAFECLIDSFFN